MELNERIIQARKQAGLTQEQLGEKLGVSRQAVSKWESGQANPDVAYIAEMCQLFGVTSDWLLLGREDSSTPNIKFCTKCGASVQSAGTYCHMCGTHLSNPEPEQPLRENDYFLYLTGSGEYSWNVAGMVAMLFAQDWAKPTFPWDGSKIDQDKAWDIIQATPMVLCSGLTMEQAAQGKSLFQNYSHMVEIYRQRDMSEDFSETSRPSASPCYIPTPNATQSQGSHLSGGAIFGLVVLGVIVAILLMSIF